MRAGPAQLGHSWGAGPAQPRGSTLAGRQRRAPPCLCTPKRCGLRHPRAPLTLPVVKPICFSLPLFARLPRRSLQTSSTCSTTATASPSAAACPASTSRPPSTSGWATPAAGEWPALLRAGCRALSTRALPRTAAGAWCVLARFARQVHPFVCCCLCCSTWRPHGLAFKTVPAQPLPPAGWSYGINVNKCVPGEPCFCARPVRPAAASCHVRLAPGAGCSRRLTPCLPCRTRSCARLHAVLWWRLATSRVWTCPASASCRPPRPASAA